MIDSEEAHRIAVNNLGGPEVPEPVLLEEYEDGYVARRKPDDERDENGRPLRVGQGCIVIDKADGTVYRTAYTGPETIVFWRRDRASGEIGATNVSMTRRPTVRPRERGVPCSRSAGACRR